MRDGSEMRNLQKGIIINVKARRETLVGNCPDGTYLPHSPVPPETELRNLQRMLKNEHDKRNNRAFWKRFLESSGRKGFSNISNGEICPTDNNTNGETLLTADSHLFNPTITIAMNRNGKPGSWPSSQTSKT
jgi:hypothetical protein